MKGEFLLLSWERGYKNIELFYKERSLIKLPNNQKLKNGLSFNDPDLGKIELKYSEKPISVDIIVDGVHSPVNASHPLKKIKTISTYFWMFAIFCLISLVLFYFINDNPIIRFAVAIEEIFFMAIYTISAVFAAKSKPWAIYLGFCTYSFVTLIFLLSLLGIGPLALAPITAIVSLIFRAAFTVFMVPYLKMAAQISRYKKYEGINNHLLDDNF